MTKLLWCVYTIYTGYCSIRIFYKLNTYANIILNILQKIIYMLICIISICMLICIILTIHFKHTQKNSRQNSWGQNLALGIWHWPKIGTWHRILGTWHLALGTWHIIGTWHLTHKLALRLGTWHDKKLALGTLKLTLGTFNFNMFPTFVYKNKMYSDKHWHINITCGIYFFVQLRF